MKSKVDSSVLTDKSVWENYYKGKSAFRAINNFINRTIFDKEIIDIMDSFIKNGDQKKRILEMGCGGSEWLPYIYKRHRLQINGIDYLQAGCNGAIKLLENSGIRKFEIHCADFFEYYKEKESRYDYVVSFGVVEHFEPPTKAIKAFSNYLNSDGILISTCPNTGGWAMSIQKYFDKGIYDNHVKFNLQDFIRFHEDAGYEILNASYTGFLSFNNLVFSNFSFLGRIAKIALKFLNAPIVWLFYQLKKIFKIKSENGILSSNMIVVARIKMN